MLRSISAVLTVICLAFFCATEAHADTFDVCTITEIGPVGTPPTDRSFAWKYEKSGSEVAKWQTAMRFLGYDEVGKVDGVWGPKAIKGSDRFYAEHFPGVAHGSYAGPEAREKIVELVRKRCSMTPPSAPKKASVVKEGESQRTAAIDKREKTKVDTSSHDSRSRASRSVAQHEPTTKSAVAVEKDGPTLSVYVNGARMVSKMRISAKTAKMLTGSNAAAPHVIFAVSGADPGRLECLRKPDCILNELQRADIAMNSIGNCTGSGCAPLAVEHAIMADIVALGATCTESQLLEVYRRHGQIAVRLDLAVGCAKEVIVQASNRAAEELSRSLATTSI